MESVTQERHDELVEAVRKMRRAQQGYFARPSYDKLSEAKKLEAIVDRLLEGQLDMFKD